MNKNIEKRLKRYSKFLAPTFDLNRSFFAGRYFVEGSRDDASRTRALDSIFFFQTISNNFNNLHPQSH